MFSVSVFVRTSWLTRVVGVGLLLLTIPNRAASDWSTSFVFLKAPDGAKQITIPLAVVETPGAPQGGYLVQRSPQPVEELAVLPPPIAIAYSGKDFFAFQLAALPNGIRYIAVLNEDKSVRFLNRNEPSIWFARIYKVPADDGKPEVVREGLQTQGNDVTIPVELQVPGIGTTKVKTLRTEVGYSLSGYFNGKPQVYSGRGAALQVSGSQLLTEGKLTLTVTVPDPLSVTGDAQASLQFEPLLPGLPEPTASGKLTDFLNLGSARFVVTGLAPDFSSANLAIVAGSLEQTVQQQLALGAQMPAFSQVDLLSRKTITREQLLSKAKSSAGVVFVFGDLAPPSGRFNRMMGPMGRPDNTILPLPPGEVVEQLGIELTPKPVVVLVTRQISIDFLYEELRNILPDYLVLTDYADPLRTTFRLPQNGPGGWYGPPPFAQKDEPSLRQLFNLPPNTLSIVAFDREGKVTYVKADAASTFLPSVAEARAILAKSTK